MIQMSSTARYVLPMVALSAVTGAFFLVGRGGFRPFGRIQRGLQMVGALPLLASGAIHLARPEIYAQIIPPEFPGRFTLVVVSGICELAGAAGLFFPKTRRPASLCLALLMIAIFPANVYVAGQNVHGMSMPEVPARTFMQAVYILVLLLAGWGRPSGPILNP